MDVVFTFFGLYVLLRLTDHYIAAKGYRGPESDHFNGTVFFSYGNAAKTSNSDFTRTKMLKWIFSRKHNGWRWRDIMRTTKPVERVEGGELVVTFVNHATLLIQTEGKNILTDPVWSKRVSPFSFIGPSRFKDVGVKFEDLPPIDVVLLSHNHYDHMDLPTLTRIKTKWDPLIIAGLGNAEYLKGKGFTNIKEMDWWDEQDIEGGVHVVCAPGQHFSSRALSDRNMTLWCGFFIETAHGDIYFAGDTGYGEFVQRIKGRYSKFRLALLPIGAFRPEWFMGPVHISPEQAVTIYDELNITTAIGIHHSTFHLADDGQDEPRERITQITSARKDTAFDFRVPENGEVFTID
jgi:L-ascorbate metabolism protein UlaG (beta-lactamase superfamily)